MSLFDMFRPTPPSPIEPVEAPKSHSDRIAEIFAGHEEVDCEVCGESTWFKEGEDQTCPYSYGGRVRRYRPGDMVVFGCEPDVHITRVISVRCNGHGVWHYLLDKMIGFKDGFCADESDIKHYIEVEDRT
jgi:hypothetical protein